MSRYFLDDSQPAECTLCYNYDDALLRFIDSVLPPFNLMELMASQNVRY
ncbi:MAG: hypothetical protein ACI4PO_08335 [Faecousia sp.]